MAQARTLADMSESNSPSFAQHSSWSSQPVEKLNESLTRQFVHGTQAMFARLELKKGFLVPRHSHPNEQITYIESGALLFRLGSEDSPQEQLVRAGETLVIPGGLPHSAEAMEDTVDFDVFAPPRQDWIARDDSYLR
jgi:quercetin dioxygenase-like cupin family protein